MKILLLGASGQLGQAIQELSRNERFPIGWQIEAWDRENGDLSNPERLLKNIEAFKPEAIINAAAYTQVDKAESEQEVCEKVNGESPAQLATYCKQRRIPLVHFSTDYVYEGIGFEPHLESEKHLPQNFYGVSKAKGDEAIMASGSDYLIFRTSWVYSYKGKNFVLTIQRLGRERDELNVVNDQVGSPTYAPDLARYSIEALMIGLERKAERGSFPSGVYHLCNSGFTSWSEFAQTILPGRKIKGIPTSNYPTPAKRPLNSRLSLQKFQSTFRIAPRPWQEALAECLQKIKETDNG